MRELETLPRAALITGGAKRIGRALVDALRADGWRVALHYRSETPELAGLDTPLLQADLSREAEVQTLIDRARDAVGPLGLLVNNASAFTYDSWQSADRESWDEHMEINLRAPFLLSQGFARQLPQDAQGLIVNLLDQRVWNFTPHFMTYTLSKAALWTLTQTLALALAPRIRVNGIAPGPTLPSSRQSDASFLAQVKGTALERAANPEDIATALRFLINARATTGIMLPVDAGQHLNWAPVSPQRNADAAASE